jgi:hypothetical protein
MSETITTTFEERLAAVQHRAEMGHIGADSIEMTDLVTVEVRGDYDETRCWTNEIVLTREKAGYAIWALAKSIGIDAEPMLKAARVEGFA